ncbi:type II toxin-antitoxin system HicB family antitoxin [Afifella sp. YEN Y35]|uniref:type II toxin-antitoxin system HicB family antitoxin n=1 Tax=Afifella sp. YEN Y35 TaxID=3388337 RepID=UPI0039E1B006
MTDYAIVIAPLSNEDGGGFVGRVPDLPGCMSDGASAEEALRNTQQAIAEWIEECRRLGRSLPEPGAGRSNLAVSFDPNNERLRG